MNRDRNTPDTPIDDVGQALECLYAERRTETWLHMGGPEPPRIVRNYFSGPYDTWSHSDTYYVTEEVANELKSSGFVSGRKHLGYTDHNQCELNSFGESLLSKYWEMAITDRAAAWVVEGIMES